MYRAWKLIMIAPIVLMMVILTNVIAQSGFTEYDNELFTIAYPSTWTVNETGVGNPGETKAETIQKMRENMPGDKNPFFGKHHSIYTALKMKLVWSLVIGN